MKKATKRSADANKALRLIDKNTSKAYKLVARMDRLYDAILAESESPRRLENKAYTLRSEFETIAREFQVIEHAIYLSRLTKEVK